MNAKVQDECSEESVVCCGARVVHCNCSSPSAPGRPAALLMPLLAERNLPTARHSTDVPLHTHTCAKIMTYHHSSRNICAILLNHYWSQVQTK